MISFEMTPVLDVSEPEQRVLGNQAPVLLATRCASAQSRVCPGAHAGAAASQIGGDADRRTHFSRDLRGCKWGEQNDGSGCAPTTTKLSQNVRPITLGMPSREAWPKCRSGMPAQSILPATEDARPGMAANFRERRVRDGVSLTRSSRGKFDPA
jgi:hypothetical protein